MKNILLPTDFSELSDNAIQYALKMFHGSDCTFHLLNVQKASNYSSDDLMMASTKESLYDILVRDSRQQLQALKEGLEYICKEESFSFEILTGYDELTDALNEVVDVRHIDLIIMGSDGASDAQERFMGSHALRVARNVECPLLVISVDYEFQGLSKILFTIDYDQQLCNKGVEYLKSLMEDREVTVKLLRMKDEDTSAEDLQLEKKKAELLIRGKENSFHVVSNVDTVEAVKTLVQVMGIDMNVMMVRKEEFLLRLLFGSSVSKILYNCSSPIFLYGLNNRESEDLELMDSIGALN